MPKPVVTLDVREDLAQGRPPCARSMQVIGTLKKGQPLRVLASFQPTPLFDKLAAHGFGHLARELANGDWEVLFDPAIKINQVLPLTASTAEIPPSQSTQIPACGEGDVTADSQSIRPARKNPPTLHG